MNRIAEIYTSESPVHYICYTTPNFKEIHEPCHKLMYVMEGKIRMSISGRQVTSHTGEYMFVGKGDFSRICTYPSEKGSRTFKMVCFNITDKDVKTYRQHSLCPVPSEYSHIILRKLEPDKMLEILFSSILLSIHHECLPGEQWARMKVQEAIHILTLTDKELSSFILNFGNYPQKDLREYMDKNYMFNAPLEKFAEHSGRSLSTFRREFRKLFGTTPSRWLMEKRLLVAYQKISEQKLRPSDVYWELGFETQAHFTRCFKQRFGVSPGRLSIYD